MAANKVLHMNAGDGENSYANNSGHQKTAMSKSMSLLDETLEEMFNEHTEFPKCLKMVDLGCANGPNTLLAMSHVMNKIEYLCKHKNIINDHDDLPEFEVFLNDLPDNDFNSLFKSLPEKNGRHFVYGLPGSFYTRLFPKNSIHFAYSSYSIHWLSQVPKGLGNKNKENIYMAMTSPPEVYESYTKQFKTDFNTFLRLRGEEMRSGGRMVLIFVGRSVENPSTKDDFSIFTELAKTLAQMVPEGLVKMDDLYSFNLPMYHPCIQEVEAAVQGEGSFALDKFKLYRIPDKNTDHEHPLDPLSGAKVVTYFIRGFMEPILASHFGNSVMNDLFRRYEKNVAGLLAIEEDASSFNIAISLRKM